MLVLLGHLNGTLRYPFAELVRHFGDVANLGVRVFFVISGFLITHLLLEEWAKTSSISLRGFYVRRVFRIFPAFYTFVAAVALLTLAGTIVVPWVDLGFAATYTINFVERKPWHVGHLWSLAVEEQFYLLWPLCLAALTIRRARRIAVGAIALAPLLRIGVWYLLPEYRPLISKAFPTICDTIATGCMLACYRQWLWDQSWYRGLLSSKAFAVVPLIVLVSNIFASHTRPDMLVGQTLRNVGIALCIDWSMRNAESLIGRFLNWAPMVWIGALSYSLYLWQQIFLNRHSASFFCSFPINVMLAFAAAILSYYVIERPCLRARVRFFPSSSQKRTSGHSPQNARFGGLLARPKGVVESGVGTAP
jgi:peptidoglycan/LPS O-acetylase OafA/YrhL